MKTKHFGCAAVLMGDQIYKIGGHDKSDSLSSVEVFSPASKQWTSLPPMKTKHFGAAAVLIGKQIYAVGGVDGSNYLSSVEVLCMQPVKLLIVQHDSSKVFTR
eukprot:3056742-Ditylum_brightwellii.AAC.1